MEPCYDYWVMGGKATITNYTGPGGNVVVPDTLGGCQVTRIASYAFERCRGLISLTLPDSVNQIGDGAFAFCSELEKITMPNNYGTRPDGWMTLGKKIFEGCIVLDDIEDLSDALGNYDLGGQTR